MTSAKEEKEKLVDSRSGDYGSVNHSNQGGIVVNLSPGCCGRFFPYGSKAELFTLFGLAWPLVLTSLSNTLLAFVSIIFCGQLGKIPLDAVALANSVINVTSLSVGMGLATACDTLFSQSFGSSNKKQTGLYLQKALIILSLACFPCWAIHLNTETLLRVLGQNQEVARLAGSYLLNYLPAVFFSFMFQVLSKYVQNQNIVIPCVVVGLLGNAVNAGLHYLLVFRLDLRTDGSALAQVGANVTFAVLMTGYILCTRMYRETWDGWSKDCLQSWLPFIKLALPGMLMVCLEWWCFEIGTILSGILSAEDLGAQSVMFQMEGIAYMIPMGLGVAVSIRVGQYLGSGDSDGARLSAKIAYCMTLVTAAIVTVLLLTLKDYIPRMFTQDPDVVSKASGLLPILAAFTFFDAMAALGGGILRGCGRQSIGAVVIFIGYYLIALPIGVPVLLFTRFQVAGMWLALLGGIIIEAIAFTVLVFTTNWELEAEQAQVRAGLKADPMLEKLPTPITEEEDEEGDVVSPISSPESARILPATTVNKGLRRSGSTSSNMAPPPYRRRYSSSQIVTTMHARRFSAPHLPTNKSYVLPEKSRRYSGRYSTPIQKDVLASLERAVPLSTGQLLLRRGLAFLICAGILVAGVFVRLNVHFPYDEQKMCIPAFPNGTYPVINTTLPICNNTQSSVNVDFILSNM